MATDLVAYSAPLSPGQRLAADFRAAIDHRGQPQHDIVQHLRLRVELFCGSGTLFGARSISATECPTCSMPRSCSWLPALTSSTSVFTLMESPVISRTAAATWST